MKCQVINDTFKLSNGVPKVFVYMISIVSLLLSCLVLYGTQYVDLSCWKNTGEGTTCDITRYNSTHFNDKMDVKDVKMIGVWQNTKGVYHLIQQTRFPGMFEILPLDLVFATEMPHFHLVLRSSDDRMTRISSGYSDWHLIKFNRFADQFPDVTELQLTDHNLFCNLTWFLCLFIIAIGLPLQPITDEWILNPKKHQLKHRISSLWRSSETVYSLGESGDDESIVKARFFEKKQRISRVETKSIFPIYFVAKELKDGTFSKRIRVLKCSKQEKAEALVAQVNEFLLKKQN